MVEHLQVWGEDPWAIIKNDILDNTEDIGKDGKHVRIARMTIDILLLCIWIGRRLERHKYICNLVGINVMHIIIKRFQIFDKSIERFELIYIMNSLISRCRRRASESV